MGCDAVSPGEWFLASTVHHRRGTIHLVVWRRVTQHSGIFSWTAVRTSDLAWLLFLRELGSADCSGYSEQNTASGKMNVSVFLERKAWRHYAVGAPSSKTHCIGFTVCACRISLWVTWLDKIYWWNVPISTMILRVQSIHRRNWGGGVHHGYWELKFTKELGWKEGEESFDPVINIHTPLSRTPTPDARIVDWLHYS